MDSKNPGMPRPTRKRVKRLIEAAAPGENGKKPTEEWKAFLATVIDTYHNENVRPMQRRLRLLTLVYFSLVAGIIIGIMVAA